jgi:hypothetical protein
MKVFLSSLLILLAMLLFSGCNSKRAARNDATAGVDTVQVPDTGYTGIKQYMSGQLLVKEVTFKNGVREGVMKSFYQTGELRQSFWYEKGLREDSAVWYFQEGQVFRTTPYKKDTIDGIQKQYFRNGRLKARLGYHKGLRTTLFEEFTADGKLVGGYPDIVFNTTDDYKTKGIYRISLELSDKSGKVRFYQGDLSGGVFDTAHCKEIRTIKGIGHIDLKKSSTEGRSFVGVVAEILTNYGNNFLAYKKIDLPYNDLK